MPTNDKKIYTFVSTTKAYISASLNTHPEVPTVWANRMEVAVAIDGNKVTVTHHLDEHTTAVQEYTITAISDNEFTDDLKITATVDGTVVHTQEETMRYVKITADFSAAILGTWQGHCTSEGSVFDDGEEHRWEYRADGSYVYYRHDGQAGTV